MCHLTTSAGTEVHNEGMSGAFCAYALSAIISMGFLFFEFKLGLFGPIIRADAFLIALSALL
jgi:hypothetical protein